MRSRLALGAVQFPSLLCDRIKTHGRIGVELQRVASQEIAAAQADLRALENRVSATRSMRPASISKKCAPGVLRAPLCVACAPSTPFTAIPGEFPGVCAIPMRIATLVKMTKRFFEKRRLPIIVVVIVPLPPVRTAHLVLGQQGRCDAARWLGEPGRASLSGNSTIIVSDLLHPPCAAATGGRAKLAAPARSRNRAYSYACAAALLATFCIRSALPQRRARFHGGAGRRTRCPSRQFLGDRPRLVRSHFRGTWPVAIPPTAPAMISLKSAALRREARRRLRSCGNASSSNRPESSIEASSSPRRPSPTPQEDPPHGRTHRELRLSGVLAGG